MFRATMTQLVGSLAILLLLSMSARSQVVGPSCSTIVGELTPCLSFLKAGGNPSQVCCKGVKEISNAAKTKADKKAVCECIKKSLSGITYDSARIPLLPKKCGLSISFPPIDRNTDCSKVMAYYTG